MVSEEVLSGFERARDIIQTSDYVVVVIKNNKILCKKKGSGIKPFLEVIEELGDNIHGSILGDRILGKASALLCRYSQAKAVYSSYGTKAAIAMLILGGIPSQIESMIPFINNRSGDDMCPFEKMLENVNSPWEAYTILKQKLL
jgi:hypothetical protein